MNAQTRLTLVVLAKVAREGVEAFQRYEAAVLPMLERHDGRLERRLRTAHGQAARRLLSGPGPGTTRTSLIQSAQATAPCSKGCLSLSGCLEVLDAGELRPYSSSGT